jgi:hypothetical protein
LPACGKADVYKKFVFSGERQMRKIWFEVQVWLEKNCWPVLALLRWILYGYTFRRLPLSQCKFTIVDPADYEWLSRYKWCVHKGKGPPYAVKSWHRRGYRHIMIFMHRIILQPPPGMFVDHINHNTLDNRRANIRPVTCWQNMCNRKKYKKNAHSKYIGVTWLKREKVWTARINVNKKSIFLGRFSSELDAAIARDLAAKKYHGQYASLNFS